MGLLNWFWLRTNLEWNDISLETLQKCFILCKSYVVASTRIKVGCFSHLKHLPNIFLNMLKIASKLVWALVGCSNAHIRISIQNYGSTKKWIGLCRVLDEQLFLKTKSCECVGDFFSFWIFDKVSAAYL